MITALDRIYPDHHMNTRVAIGSNIKSSQRSISTAQQTSNPGSNCSLRPERERGKEGNEKLPGREELDGLGNGEGSEGGQEREICENGRRRRRRRWRRRPRCHSRALNHHHHHTLIHLQLNHLSAFSAASKFFFFPLFWDRFQVLDLTTAAGLLKWRIPRSPSTRTLEYEIRARSLAELQKPLKMENCLG